MPRLLIFSDVHNDTRALQRLLSSPADYYVCAGDLVSWARGFDRMGDFMKDLKERVWMLPGNHESAADIAAFCARFSFVNFHERVMEVGGFHVAGLGYSNPTPFKTPGEYSEKELAERLEKFAGLQPLVLVCHVPPAETALDGIRPGAHFGSTAVRAFIEKEQPQYFFCGHIHETEGVVIEMGRTRAQNVGKQGYLLELP